MADPTAPSPADPTASSPADPTAPSPADPTAPSPADSTAPSPTDPTAPSPGPPAHPRLSNSAAAVLTFVAAAVVLVLEIAAGRLLAPFVGVSLTTYTGIIGVILGGIALGAWAGGRAADRVGAERLLGSTFLAGGWTAIASVPIVTLAGAADVYGGTVVEIVFLAALGFVAPATILSAVPPMIVRATIRDVATSGSLVGRLSAVGTAGALVGTFLTGFVLLGLLPTRLIILAAGALLVLIGLGLTWRLRGAGSPVVVGLLASLVLGGSPAATPWPCDRETAYYCLSILEEAADPDARTLVLDGLHHARVDLRDPTELTWGYVIDFAEVSAGPIARQGGAVMTVHIGGGGFSVPRFLDAVYPEARQTVLELDPGVYEAARTELGFAPSDRVDVWLGDARLSLARLPDDVYDVAFGDAFGGLAVPWHLTTREFLAEVDRVLTPDGLYVMNLIDYWPYRFARAETATARSLFPHVAIVAAPGLLVPGSGGNVVLVASRVPIDVADIEARFAERPDRGPGAIVVGAPLDAFVGDASILTDDHAPVDQLLGR